MLAVSVILLDNLISMHKSALGIFFRDRCFNSSFSSLKYRLGSLLSRGLMHTVSLQTAERAQFKSAVTAMGKELCLSTVP